MGLSVATASVAVPDLVIRGLCGTGLGCAWPSAPTFVGGFSIFQDVRVGCVCLFVLYGKVRQGYEYEKLYDSFLF